MHPAVNWKKFQPAYARNHAQLNDVVTAYLL